MATILLLFVLSLTLASAYHCGGGVAVAVAEVNLGFIFHHRFSDPVRRWAESRAHPGAWFPEKGSAEYYAAHVRHDRALRLRRRSLDAAGDDELTCWMEARGEVNEARPETRLHYALVTLGTPNVTFLATLDTGSDLFWVPCDCKKCAPDPSLIYDTEVLKQLSLMGRLVVCAGDGAVESSTNLALLRYGISIWIDVPIELLANETLKAGDLSPSETTLDTSNSDSCLKKMQEDAVYQDSSP